MCIMENYLWTWEKNMEQGKEKEGETDIFIYIPTVGKSFRLPIHSYNNTSVIRWNDESIWDTTTVKTPILVLCSAPPIILSNRLVKCEQYTPKVLRFLLVFQNYQTCLRRKKVGRRKRRCCSLVHPSQVQTISVKPHTIYYATGSLKKKNRR